MSEKIAGEEYFQQKAERLCYQFLDSELSNFDKSNGYASGVILGILSSMRYGCIIKSQPFLLSLLGAEFEPTNRVANFEADLVASGIVDPKVTFQLERPRTPESILRSKSLKGVAEVTSQAIGMIKWFMKDDEAAAKTINYLSEVGQRKRPRGDTVLLELLRELTTKNGARFQNLPVYVAEEGLISPSGDLVIDLNPHDRPR